mgnify:CR=1 FL=1
MEFMNHVEKTVARAAKAANELKEISKIKYSVYDLNQDVKKLYTEIGKSAYEQLKDSADLPEDIQIKFEILEAKLAKIASLRAKEAHVRNHKNGIYCPSCGRFCDVGLNYCPDCGTELAETVEGEVHAENAHTEPGENAADAANGEEQ